MKAKMSRAISKDQRKMEFALVIHDLRQFTADEIAGWLGTSRQNISLHARKRGKK